MERLLNVLDDCGVALSAEELLDVLWLARRVPGGSVAPLVQAVAGVKELGGDGPPAEAAGQEPPEPVPPVEPAPQDVPVHAAAVRSEDRQTAAGPKALAVRLPEERALGADGLRLGRALRPLRLRRPTAQRTEMDEAATVAAYVETGLPDVVLRPGRERGLDLVLVVDDGLSMLLWRRLGVELRSLLERLGAFRVVRVHGLCTRGPEAPYLSARAFVPGPRLPASVAADPSGRSLVLVVSDGVGEAWRDGRMRPVLDRWAGLGPTAVMQVLPTRLWSGSGIRSEPWRVTARQPGAANGTWQVDDPLLPPGAAEFDGVPVPVLQPVPKSVAAWARLVGTAGASTTVPLLAPRFAAPQRRPAATRGPDPAAAVLRFRDAASPEAYRLAAHLAVLGPVSVPVMRLVQQAVPWRCETAHLAEVFLGGLMRPVTDGGPPHQRGFQFAPEAREILLDALPTAELAATSRAVAGRLAQLGGDAGEFPAWLAHPDGGAHLPGDGRPFTALDPGQMRGVGASLAQGAGEVGDAAAQPSYGEGAFGQGPFGGGPAEREDVPGSPVHDDWEPLRAQDLRALGPYRLLLRNDRSGFAVNYLAENEHGERALIRVPRTPEVQMAGELLSVEAEALRRMNGRFAPRVLANGIDERPPWLAVELITDEDGEPAPSLETLSRTQGPLGVGPRFVQLGWQLAEALSVCRLKGIVHLGLNPNSITVAQGSVCITSWSRAQIDGRSPGELAAERGPARYQAPGYDRRAEKHRPAADIYTLGLLLAEAGSGRMLRYGLRDTSLGPWADALPSALRGTLERCLREDPRERPTAREVADTFARFLPLPYYVASRTQAPPLAHRRRPTWAELDGTRTPESGSLPAASAGQRAGRAEEERQRRLRLIRTPVAGCRRIAVIGPNRGTGRTTTTIVLGSLLTVLRDDKVLAVDADPDTGPRDHRVRTETGAPLRGLVQAVPYPGKPLDVYRFTQAVSRQGHSSVDAFPGTFAPTREDYRQAMGNLSRAYPVILTDSGGDLTSRVMGEVLGQADQLLIVTTPSADNVSATRTTLDRLSANGHADLVSQSIVVLSDHRATGQAMSIENLVAYFRAGSRRIVLVPFDEHLAEGTQIDLDLLRPRTRDAYINLAAMVAEGFADPRPT